jgi:hypothetical protein
LSFRDFLCFSVVSGLFSMCSFMVADGSQRRGKRVKNHVKNRVCGGYFFCLFLYLSGTRLAEKDSVL